MRGFHEDLSEFYRDKHHAKGRTYICKVCGRKKDKRYYQIKSEEIKKRNKDIYLRDREHRLEIAHLWVVNNPDKVREIRRRSYKKSPEKYKARQLVREEIRKGNIKRGACSMCGKEKAEAHHPDYSKPLDIMWLCRFHHGVVEGRSVVSSLSQQSTEEKESGDE